MSILLCLVARTLLKACSVAEPWASLAYSLRVMACSVLVTPVR